MHLDNIFGEIVIKSSFILMIFDKELSNLN
jgi:hypothetical protein